MYAPSTTQDTTPAPAISLQTLRTVLAKGQAAHPELAVRMERAALVLIQQRISPAMAAQNVGAAYWVEASDGSREYWVTLDVERGYRGDRCTCPDAANRGNPCKHSIACRLLVRCLEREGRGDTPPPPPPPVALPFPAADPDAPIGYALTARGLAVTVAPLSANRGV